MNDKTTNASNDVSRNELKQVEVSDESLKKIITQWADGEWIYVAATDPEFIDKALEENSSSSSSSSGTTRRAKHIKTSSAVTKRLRNLINYLTVTIGAKPQNEKTDKVRKYMKKKTQEKAEATKQNKEGRDNY